MNNQKKGKARMNINLLKKAGLFAGGILFGTAGLKILTSDDAKKVYTHTTAAALRAKDCIKTTTTKAQENVEDILAEAKEINKEREAAKFVPDEEIVEEAETVEENLEDIGDE